MRQDNQTFAAANAGPAKSPRFTIALSFDTANTDVVYLTSFPSGSPVEGVPAGATSIVDVVSNLSGVSQTIDPNTATSTIGGIQFSVLDSGSALTTLINARLDGGDGLRGKRVQVWAGFDTIDWLSYELRYTYVVTDIAFDDGIYTFRCSDPQRFAKRDIFLLDSTRLTAAITATSDHIPVSETSTTGSFFLVPHDAGYSDAPSVDCTYVKIGDEIIRVGSHPTEGNGITALYVDPASPSDGISLYVLDVGSPVSAGRGALRTTAKAVDLVAGADTDRQPKVEEYVYLEGPAPKIAYGLMTGILEGDQSSSPQTTYPANWHAGVDPAFMRLSDFTGIGTDLWDTSNPARGRQVRFTGLKKTDAKQFIERELYLWMGCYPPVYSNGEIGLQRLTPLLSNAGYTALLDDKQITSYGNLTHEMSQVINDISIEWNWQDAQREYTRESLFVDSDSVSAHGDTATKRYKFRGVHTAANVDADLRTFVDTIRDRYANPPQTLNVTVMPSMNTIEVGDTVRVELDQIRDYVTGTTLARSFEVQKVQTNWLTGEISLALFASSAVAGSIEPSPAGNVLNDATYVQGTELSTVLTIVADAVTVNGTLTGGATMTDFYYLGNLTINSGVTVTISDNVRLWIRGTLTIDGDIDGAGNGLTGGVGATLFTQPSPNATTVTIDYAINGVTNVWWETNRGTGSGGYLGGVKGGWNIVHDTNDNIANSVPAVDQVPPPDRTSLPRIDVVNSAGTALLGLPDNLRGSSGPGGDPAISAANIFDATGTLAANGGAGGDGGAGLTIICRGLAFGVSGAIDLSGADGVAGSSATINGLTVYAGSGGGGAPGALLVLYDGNVTPPDLETNVTAARGNSPTQGTPLPLLWLTNRNTDTLSTTSPLAITTASPGYPALEYGPAAYRNQRIPPVLSVEEEIDNVHQITTPSAPSLTRSATDVSRPDTTSRLLAPMSISWTASTDPDFAAYEIQARRTNAANWRTISVVRDSTITETVIDIKEGEAWEGRIRILSVNGSDGHSEWSATGTLTMDFSAPGLFLPFQQIYGSANTQFGYSVSLDRTGNFALVGAFQGSPAGAANMYARRGVFTVVNSSISSPNTATDQNFGAVVSVSQGGRRFLIHDPETSADGTVVFYRYLSAGAFAVDLNTTGPTDSLFGFSAQLNKDDGSRAIVGGPDFNNGAVGDGRVWFYSRVGNTWTNTQTSTGGASSGEGYGRTVAISADGLTAVFTAPGQVTFGRMYIFRWDTTVSPNAWTERDTWDAPSSGLPTGNDARRAISISDDGSVIVVSNALDTVWVLDEGTTDVWTLTETLSVANDGAVALGPGNAPTRLAIGDPNFDGDFSNTGVVYIYERDDDNTFNLIQTVEPFEPLASQSFGWSIDMNHNTLIVGNNNTTTAPVVEWFQATNIYES